MSGPRLVLITRRFWPLVGGAEVIMARLATAFQAAGARATLLTAQWHAEWPAEIEHHGVRVVRLDNPALRGWGTWRYMRSVAHWLEAHRSQFDLAYVSMLKHDAYAALGQARRGRFPVVLRAEGSGASGDCHWQEHARFGRLIRRRCRKAAALVSISPAIHVELLAAGYPASRIHDITNGVAVSPPRDQAERLAARRSLAEANPALALASGATVALYTGRLNDVKGLRHAVAAWPSIAERWPNARLWLVGEGPARATLVRQIDDLGLSGRIVLPGAFDDVEDFLLAADLFLLPSYDEGISISLLEALAAGLPAIASAIPGNQAIVEDRTSGLLVPPGDEKRLSAAIAEVIERPDFAAQLGTAGRARAAARFSLEKTARDHLALFEQLLRAERLE
ncbi:MAG: glycosyltransferase family 4 protein [Planctomycetia bacterium]|nr:glycosyltransferase family 4 protein [Planctomycetia bacterium]